MKGGGVLVFKFTLFLFRAVASWAKGNPEAEVSQVLKEIRLSLLSIQVARVGTKSKKKDLTRYFK